MNAWKPTYTRKEWFIMATQVAGIGLLFEAFLIAAVYLA